MANSSCVIVFARCQSRRNWLGIPLHEFPGANHGEGFSESDDDDGTESAFNRKSDALCPHRPKWQYGPLILSTEPPHHDA